MNRTGISALTLGVAALLTGTQRAASPIAIVNVPSILGNIPQYMSADSLLTKQSQVYETLYQNEADSLQTASAKLQQNAIGVSPTTRDAQQKKLAAQFDSLQIKRADYGKKLQDLRDQLEQPIEDHVRDVIEAQRLIGGYSVVLNYNVEGSAIVAVDKTLDITLKVLDALKSSPWTPAAVPPVSQPAGATTPPPAGGGKNATGTGTAGSGGRGGGGGI
jgi:Skp family chaperone for outer membrane proteins